MYIYRISYVACLRTGHSAFTVSFQLESENLILLVWYWYCYNVSWWINLIENVVTCPSGVVQSTHTGDINFEVSASESRRKGWLQFSRLFLHTLVFKSQYWCFSWLRYWFLILISDSGCEPLTLTSDSSSHPCLLNLLLTPTRNSSPKKREKVKERNGPLQSS